MVFFKRWSRKNYAVFNSLKREIKICIIDVCLHINAPALIREVFSFRQHSDEYPPEKEDDLIWNELECSQLMTLSNTKDVLVESPRSFYRILHCYTTTTISLKPTFQFFLLNQKTSWILFNDSNNRKGFLLSFFS